ncbi:putative redox protein Fmp46p, mitochondrial [Diutina catenulata]
MFRTVQNGASALTLFHNSRSKVSEQLYHALKGATSSKLADRISLDVAANQMPTYNQFQTIVSNVPADDSYQQGVLRAAFPWLKRSSVLEDEYEVFHEAFSKAQANPELPDQGSEVFQAPLVVDWDKAQIANDPEGLKKILEAYE